ncbi:MAG: tRNA threonylcarbamoyladenosine dehydratase [Clostridiales bacterium]|jgi:tRNA A37 threonylcarbamoyladenosine dehydratase|nr:tRNA threonylcarbamoyladenosine dehydratase [Clostridiales bacterium]
MERHRRTINLIGEEALMKLEVSSVLILGVGGVGSYAAEAIARAGIGKITIIDGDTICQSNLNRQLVALESTLGKLKAVVEAERIRDINPEINVDYKVFFYKAGMELPLEEYDYVIDAIDDVDAKVAIIKECNEKNIKIISSMGTAGKLLTEFKVADISKTSMCPLAKTMRKNLRAIGIEHLPVVFSEEKPTICGNELGTLSYVPGAAGLTLAGYVIRELAEIDK